MKTTKLNDRDRDFYRTIRQAIFANPFSEQRAEADKLILGSRAQAKEIDTVQELAKSVKYRLSKTFANGHKTIHLYDGEDRILIQYSVLFLIYHQYCSDFDNNILEQIESGDVPCKVPFARQLLTEIVSYGLNRQDASRYFSLFFQMRRAFYFIDRIIGGSRCMKELRWNLWNNIFTHDIALYEKHLWNRMEDFSTMLLGQTGTGKGLTASAIGRSGFIPFDEKQSCFTESFTKAFVPINLSQFPEQLLESELFGHKKGAFTGAVENHEGVFSRCSQHGAIFLDEIGEVTIPVQIKLLQVLQDRTFAPVGSHVKKRFQGRVIAATNRSLKELRQKEIFRDDFYYRLCSDIIVVPPLVQRIQENPGELKELLSHVVGKIVGKPSPDLVTSVAESIKKSVSSSYSWPGNVRELEQCVRRILLKEHYEGDTAALKESYVQDRMLEGFAEGEYTAQQLMSLYCRTLYGKFGTYEEVSRMTGLDRRTVKKHIENI